MTEHNHSTREGLGAEQDGKSRSNIALAIVLNFSFSVLELIGGLLTNSLAILSDALHDLGDSITLISSYFLEGVAKKRRTDPKRTFGYQRLSVLSAVINAVVLIGGTIVILHEGITRLVQPEPVSGLGMIGLAIVGVAFNGISSWRMSGGQSMNEKVLTWHLLEDVLGWVAILIGGILVYVWGSVYIDPVLTIGFSAFILWGALRNMHEVFNIFMQGVPKHIDAEKVRETIENVEGVMNVHDLHIWSLEGETDVLSAHIVVRDDLMNNTENILREIKAHLQDHHIEHSTLEIEPEGFCAGD